MKENVKLNELGNVKAAVLDWGEVALPVGIPPKQDILLLADCVYFEPAFPLLGTSCLFLSRARHPFDSDAASSSYHTFITHWRPAEPTLDLFRLQEEKKSASFQPHCGASSRTDPILLYASLLQADRLFFQQLSKHFVTAPVEDDPNRGVYERQGLKLMMITRKVKPVQAAKKIRTQVTTTEITEPTTQ